MERPFWSLRDPELTSVRSDCCTAIECVADRRKSNPMVALLFCSRHLWQFSHAAEWNLRAVQVDLVHYSWARWYPEQL